MGLEGEAYGTTIGGNTLTDGCVHLETHIPATLKAGHSFTYPLLTTVIDPTTDADPNDDPVNHNTSINLGDENSVVNIPVGVQEQSGTTAAEPEDWLITAVGKRKFVKSLTLDKSTATMDRMACINSPFGNVIEFQMTNVSPTMNPTKDHEAPHHYTGKTDYKCNLNTQKMGGAVVLSFSLLVEKSSTKY